jgi:hypothetical protein
MKAKTIGGVEFQAERPGLWYSVDRRFVLSHAMAGTSAQQWELYRCDPHDADNPFDVLISSALSMSEIVNEFAEIDLNDRDTVQP